MKNTVLFTLIASSFALATACGGDRTGGPERANEPANEQADEPANEPGAGEVAEEAAADVGDVLEDVGEAVVQGTEETISAVGAAIDKELDEIDALGLTVRNLLGEEVRTRTGLPAAKVDDILFDQYGRPSIAVLSEGGVLGVGDDLVYVNIKRLLLKEAGEGEVAVEVTLTDEELEQMGDGVNYLPVDFSIGGDIDASLMSARKLIDVAVYNSEDRRIADVYDIALGVDWSFDQVIVSRGGLGEVGDKLIALPWAVFSLSNDRSSLRTSGLAIDFDALPAFEYHQLVDE